MCHNHELTLPTDHNHNSVLLASTVDHTYTHHPDGTSHDEVSSERSDLFQFSWTPARGRDLSELYPKPRRIFIVISL